MMYLYTMFKLNKKMVLPVNWIPNLLLKSTQKGIKLKRGGRICTFGMMDFLKNVIISPNTSIWVYAK